MYIYANVEHPFIELTFSVSIDLSGRGTKLLVLLDTDDPNSENKNILNSVDGYLGF